ncbi:Mu-like prophage FluMu protein gp27 [Mizugakiibacter sediminis]|uniref:Mu-like prophage FluMu protein gp27 n=1 Tax=Mizugakiibacter sediminis TaxID=1475481 RepID=A0A0K8QPD8_9GAMM|nr:DUF3486 family protein [Mizugakiibacter sediminis]GAP66277.1 Mu-like prophage FluMu protein gp27 [Mizugakiibacter sediminis]
MPPRSKIARLPPAVKDWLDKALVESNFSGYEALAAELRARGYDVSKTAVHHYGQEFEDRLHDLRIAHEQAKAVVSVVPDEEGAMNDALVRLVQDRLFKLLRSGDGKIDLAKVGRAIADLGRASIQQKKWQAEVRAKVEAAAQQVEAKCRAAGISPETLASITQDIYGIA